jgi:hypothetical protein
LASLELSLGELDQLFQPAQTVYTAEVGYLTKTVEILATATDAAATIRVNGSALTGSRSPAMPLSEGRNAFAITVQRGTEQRDYTLDVTRKAQGSFTQTAYLKASHPDADDVFGTVIASSGAMLAVGSPYEDSAARGINGDSASDARLDSGAVTIFSKNVAGAWAPEAYLKASNADQNDNFGASVAVSGNIVAVGARQESSAATGVNGNQSDNSALGAGAVYVFVRDASGAWSQEAYIKADNAAAGSAFGSTLALDGNTLAIGAPHAPALEGSVYVFVRSATGEWTQQAVLRPSDATQDFGFAQALALKGDTLIVGSHFHGGIFNPSGAVYTFVRSNGVWQQEPILKGSNTQRNDYFGESVAFDGATLVVGASGEASNATGVGGNQSNNTASGSGAAYVFERASGGGWTQRAYIKASNTGTNDGFGYAVAVAGDWLVVGAPNEDSAATGVGGAQTDNARPESGAAYLYSRNGTGDWAQELYIKSANADTNDYFGRTVLFDGAGLFLGAPFEDSGSGIDPANNLASASGAVYVIE